MKNNIAVFGGSFNPPTLAHERVVSGVLETGNKVDRIILLPSGIREDKNFGLKKEERRILIEAFYNGLLEQNLPVEIDNYFFEGNNRAETTTLQEDAYFKEARKIDPEFVYGSDVIPNMQAWKGNTKKFIEHIHSKIFIHRKGYESVNPDDYDMRNYRFIEISGLPNISSTLAKEKIRNSQNLARILDPTIVQLIADNQLYQTEKNGQK